MLLLVASAVLPPQAAASALAGLSVTLRFDGSLRGRSGGAGAVLLHEGMVVWQAARYLERPATSAHAEYEGLLLGLRGAHTLQVGRVLAEGDCRLVLRQMDGTASARKLSRLHGAAMALAAALPQPLTLAHIPRAENGHADCLSRLAVDTQARLLSTAVLGTEADGRRGAAVDLLSEAAERRGDCRPARGALCTNGLCPPPAAPCVHMPCAHMRPVLLVRRGDRPCMYCPCIYAIRPSHIYVYEYTASGLRLPAPLYDEMLARCDAAADWPSFLCVFRLAQVHGVGGAVAQPRVRAAIGLPPRALAWGCL